MLLDLADPDLLDDIAEAVSDEPDMTAFSAARRHGARPVDVRIADEAAASAGGPLVLLTDDPAAAEKKPYVRAILPKDAPADLVAAAARLAAAGYSVRKLEEPSESGDAEDSKPHFEPESALTQREMQVLALLADGASNKVIARKLDISVHTAKFHVASVMTKLRARNRTDAISIALREGVLMA